MVRVIGTGSSQQDKGRRLSQLALIVDLDDTLTDRAGAFVRWAKDFLERNGLMHHLLRDLVALDQRGVRPRPDFFSHLATLFDLDFDQAVELSRYRLATASPLPNAGVPEVLSDARSAGASVIVLSNGVGEIQRRKLENSGLIRHVDYVVVSGEVSCAKPDPAIFELALSHAVVSADAWMVGDNFDCDIRAARRAGLGTAWVRNGNPDPPDVSLADIALPDAASCLTAVIERHIEGH